MLAWRLGLSFFFNDTATTEIYTLSLHDALPILHGHHPNSAGRLLQPMKYGVRPIGVQDLLKVHHICLFRQLGVFFGSQVRDSASRQAANPAPPSRLRSVIGDDGHFKVVAMLRLKRAAHLDRIAAAAIRCHPFHLDRKSTRLNSSHGYISYA